MSDVIWKAVTGWEGLYEVSSEGEVRSVDRIVPRARTGDFKHKGKVLKQFPDKDGYPAVKLCGPNKRTKVVHQIVCEAFHGPKPDGHEVGHNDGTRTNNRADNLRWITDLQNQHERWLSNSESAGGKLRADEVLAIRSALAKGASKHEIARAFGVTYGQVARIETRKAWAFLEHSE